MARKILVNGTGWDKLGQVGTSGDKWGQLGMSGDKLGHVGTNWDKLGWVGNQRNYRILTLKKTSCERKKEEEYRI